MGVKLLVLILQFSPTPCVFCELKSEMLNVPQMTNTTESFKHTYNYILQRKISSYLIQ
jgi:hypothetical protein